MAGVRPKHDDIDKLHDYGLYIPTRTIYVGSEEFSQDSGESGTDGAMAARLIKNLHILDRMSKDQITIIMNNIGGCEYSCFAMIDAIKACESPVEILGTGHVMSAGSLILQAADERIMAPNAVQMIHYGTWGYDGHSKDFQKWAKEGKRIDEWMEEYYLEKIHAKDPDFTLERLRKMLERDTFLTAEESVKLGLCDRIQGA